MSMQLEKRTGFGNMGRPVEIIVNCFEVTRKPEFVIQQYDVSFSDTRVKEKRAVIEHILKTQGLFGRPAHEVVYDGNAILYMPGPAQPGTTIKTSEAAAKGRPTRPDRPGPVLEVTLKHALTINMADLANLVQGRLGAPNANLLQAINALNVAIKWDPSGNFPHRRNNFYVPPGNQAKLLGSGLEVWAGYFTSIRPGIGKMIMNFDRGAGAFKCAGNAVQIMLQYTNRRDPADLELSRMPPHWRMKFKRFLKNLTVRLPEIRRDPNQKYKIRAISNESAAEYLFDANGQQMSIRQYIEQKYNIRLQYPYLPCVQLTKIAWYPLECCDIQRGTQFLGKLEPDQVQSMLKFTTQRPPEKLNSLKDGMQHLKLGGANQTLRSWNFDVAQAPMVVKGRLLDAPSLEFGDPRSNQRESVPVKNGEWQSKGALKPGAPIERWFVVVFASDTASRDGFPLQGVRAKITDFVAGCRRFGLKVLNDKPFILHVGQTPDVFRAIKDAAKRAGYGPNNLPQLVVTFCLNKSSPEYAGIKSACDVQLGIPSQNLLVQKMQKAGPQYWLNVALKVNVKLQGGVNHRIANWLPGFDKNVTCVMGADVTHPGPGSLLPSIAGVVASCDPYGSQYSAAVRAQNSREEIIIDLESIAQGLIRNYGNTTGKPPARIIFYRDGVSEGQFDEVARREITALKKACTNIKPTYNPEITFIISGKRHHVKLFPRSPQEADRSGNVRSGTVVDRDIGSPYYSDFYLMSHSGLLGTSKCSHYSVLLNESKLSADQLEALTHHICHVYARSTRAVSVATPAYYAHHVCFRARQWVGEDDNGTEVGSMSPEQEDAAREQRLVRARNSLGQGVNPSLNNTLYWM